MSFKVVSEICEDCEHSRDIEGGALSCALMPRRGCCPGRTLRRAWADPLAPCPLAERGDDRWADALCIPLPVRPAKKPADSSTPRRPIRAKLVRLPLADAAKPVKVADLSAHARARVAILQACHTCDKRNGNTCSLSHRTVTEMLTAPFWAHCPLPKPRFY